MPENNRPNPCESHLTAHSWSSMRNARVSRRNLRNGFLLGSGPTFYHRLNRPNMASEAAAAYSPGVGSTAQMVA
jgi:hypothetical protein